MPAVWVGDRLVEEEQFLRGVLRDNVAAVQLVRQIARVSQIVDDLHDGDKPVSRDHLKTMIWMAMVEIPSNAFYRQYFADLQPVVRSVLADWFDSTLLERGSEHDQSLAFVLRDNLVQLVSQCAYLIGGVDWMANVGPQVRRQFHDESLADFAASLMPKENTPKSKTRKPKAGAS